MAHANSNPRKIFNHRLKNSKSRLMKIQSIAKISRRARILFSGSGLPAATFGHAACGLSRAQIESLEMQAANCSGITKPGRCRTLALVLAYGRYGTPLARIIHETTTAWFNTLCDYLSRGNHIDVIRAWSKAHKTLKNSRKNAEYSNAGTRGLMSNVISMLLNLGWYPTAYNVWEDPVTGTWTLTDASVAPHLVIRKLIHSSHTNIASP